jgi:hypothetical protein
MKGVRKIAYDFLDEFVMMSLTSNYDGVRPSFPPVYATNYTMCVLLVRR